MDYDRLIVDRLTGQLSPRGEAELRDWRESHPKNENRYQAFGSLWNAASERVTPLATAPPSVQTIASTARFRHRKWCISSRFFWKAAALAASFAAALGLTHLWGETVPSGNPPHGEIITGVGETATARLADGTVVRLAPESRLTLPFDEREVVLDGRAFFAVAADPEAPFLVRTPSGDARVLGTRFELNVREGGLRLVVVEGLVSVTSGTEAMDVSSRQVSHFRAGEVPSIVDMDDVWPLLNWLGDFLAFESTPLREVRHELERRFGVTLVFNEPTIADEAVTVQFGDETIEEVVSVICRLTEARCAMEGSRVTMFRTQ